jgi:hypothetical protein
VLIRRLPQQTQVRPPICIGEEHVHTAVAALYDVMGHAWNNKPS